MFGCSRLNNFYVYISIAILTANGAHSSELVKLCPEQLKSVKIISNTKGANNKYLASFSLRGKVDLVLRFSLLNATPIVGHVLGSLSRQIFRN